MISLFGEIINDKIKIPQKKLQAMEKESKEAKRRLLPKIKVGQPDSPDNFSNGSETKKENGGDTPTSDIKNIDSNLRINSSILTSKTKPNLK